MFRWYARAEVCLAYLTDVAVIDSSHFSHSEWWTRGWTLQELLAPSLVVFLTKGWQVIGHKGRLTNSEDHAIHSNPGLCLDESIAAFTRIPVDVLRNYEQSRGLSPQEKLALAAGRKTSREEDMSYCLLGLLDVAMVANYGEGGDRARRRLLREVLQASRTADPTNLSSSDLFTIPEQSLARQYVGAPTSAQMYEKLRASLHFPQIDGRKGQIDNSYHGTYQWTLLSISSDDTEWDNFVAWLQNPECASHLYWISAKPGAGKSNLIHFLEENLNPSQHMFPWSQQSEVLIASYYFWNPGNILQKSLAGLLRTLLYQLLERSPETVLSCLLQDKQSHIYSSHSTNIWTKLELRKHLRQTMSVMSSSIRILILVDGLDELHGSDDDREELIELLQELGRYPFVKLCVSSRRWTIFQDAFNMCPQLRLENLNAGDISLYVQGQLGSQTRFQQILRHDNRGEQLLKDITTKAQGVFLWTRLVVKDLLRGVRDGDSLETLQQKVENVPGELNDYFSQMMETIDAHHRPQACAVLQIALHDENEWIQLSSLRLMDFVFIAHASTDFALTDQLQRYVSELASTDALVYTLDSTLRMLSSRCKGLLDCFFHENSAFFNDTEETNSLSVSRLPNSVITALRLHKNVAFDLRVDFMHRSLRDFLLEPDNQHFLHQHTGGPFDARNYLRNARLCQLFICMNWRLRTEAAVGHASYVICTMSSPHFRRTARCAHFASKLQHALGYILINLDYMPEYWYIYGTFKLWHQEQSSFLSLAIDFNWAWYLETALTAEVVRTKQGRPILDYILRPRFSSQGGDNKFSIGNQYPMSDLVRRVVSLGADPNELYDGIPVWSRFLTFVLYYGRTVNKTDTLISAYALSIAAMLGAGASLSVKQQHLQSSVFMDPSDRYGFALAPQSTEFGYSLGKEISVTDVFESLRFFLGNAVDFLNEVAEQQRTDRFPSEHHRSHMLPK